MGVQAACLEHGVAGSLAALLPALLGSSEAAAEITAQCTMALEMVTVLFNPDVCLDPTSPAPQRVVDETPNLDEVPLSP